MQYFVLNMTTHIQNINEFISFYLPLYCRCKINKHFAQRRNNDEKNWTGQESPGDIETIFFFHEIEVKWDSVKFETWVF